ncbi:MAG: ParB N-terminal domain-containing protein [Sedimentisphaerales bacterium]|nr:ParB N-terminal domain-containing protein [Sedimentisphaerales bacterium]
MTMTADPPPDLIELLRLVPITTERVDRLYPAPENEELYRKVVHTDPDIMRLIDSIDENGLLEPLIVTEDGCILSGHRRYAAIRRLGWEEVIVRVVPINREDDPDKFLVLLREANRQRVKSIDELIREEVISTSPESAYETLQSERLKRTKTHISAMDVSYKRQRSRINHQRQEFLQAAIQVIKDLSDYWPVSLRQIHYRLLNNPPLTKASDPKSRYRNDRKSYANLSRLLVQARNEDLVNDEVFDDATRPTTTWNAHSNVSEFVRKQLDEMFTGYYRNLIQSQERHFEIVIEKNTIARIVEPVAGQFCIPVTSGRGYSSRTAQAKLIERFDHSGKDMLAILMMTDLDPDGLAIADSFIQNIRDEFGVQETHGYRVALTGKQVESMKLPAGQPVKKTARGYDKFVKKYGPCGWELEAAEPEQLQQALREAITGLIDIDLYNAEIDQERRDAMVIDEYRQRVLLACRNLRPDGGMNDKSG